VVDIGGGTTDVAVISLSGIVYSRSVRVAGNEMDDAIVQYMKRKYNLLIGESTAEKVKIQIGSAYPLDKPLSMEIKGRNLIEGVPRTITVEDAEIREALSDNIATIMNAIRVALERTPPELSADISDRGIVLTGGGAMIKNLDKRIRQETGLPVSIAEDPLASVVLGTGKMLTEFKLLRRIAIE
jgi:rod shape-determining protein MreB